MNSRRFRTSPVLLAVAVFAIGPAAAQADPDGPIPPAGQMCPQGAYVIGFDAQSNIVCSDIPTAPSAAVVPAPSAPSATATPAIPETPVTAVSAPAPAAAAAPTVVYASPPVELDIEDIEPSSVVYGKREVTVRVIGSGFGSGTVVSFRGQQIPATSNAAGTELMVTLPTRNLSIGAYAITVENPSGVKVTLKRAIEVY